MAREQQHDTQPGDAGNGKRAAPAHYARKRQHGDRSRCPADIARERVHAVGAGQPRLADGMAQDRVIGGVEHAVAEARQHYQWERDPEARDQAHERDARRRERQAAQEHAACAEPIDQGPGGRLRQTRGRVEARDQHARFLEADP